MKIPCNNKTIHIIEIPPFPTPRVYYFGNAILHVSSTPYCTPCLTLRAQLRDAALRRPRAGPARQVLVESAAELPVALLAPEQAARVAEQPQPVLAAAPLRRVRRPARVARQDASRSSVPPVFGWPAPALRLIVAFWSLAPLCVGFFRAAPVGRRSLGRMLGASEGVFFRRVVDRRRWDIGEEDRENPLGLTTYLPLSVLEQANALTPPKVKNQTTTTHTQSHHLKTEAVART